jgi:hypothetical protein
VNPSEDETTDLEVRVFQRQANGYPVELTLAGQQVSKRGYLPADIVPWISSGALTTDGAKLFTQLSASHEVVEAWAEARGRAPRRRLRLRIGREAAELHALPWELLQDGPYVLSAQAGTPFSRYLPVALPWGGAVTERPIRVLVAISILDDMVLTGKLAEQEFSVQRKAPEDAFQAVPNVSVTFLPPPVTLERLEEALRQNYHIVHFPGARQVQQGAPTGCAVPARCRRTCQAGA